jgi:hypothetical protein
MCENAEIFTETPFKTGGPSEKTKKMKKYIRKRGGILKNIYFYTKKYF